jgi:hypothetical protein
MISWRSRWILSLADGSLGRGEAVLGVQDLAEDAGKKGGWCWGSRTFPKTRGRKEALLGEQDLAGDVKRGGAGRAGPCRQGVLLGLAASRKRCSRFEYVYVTV